MRNGLFLIFGVLTSLLIISALIYSKNSSLRPSDSPQALTYSPSKVPPSAVSSPPPALTTLNSSNGLPSSPTPQATESLQPLSQSSADLSTDAEGLSKATVVMNTSEGIVKFKFYSKDAPKTVHRIVELIQSGFYNGLLFHRVVPGFVVQGGDPQGNGTGGSGQKLEAEFNSRRHMEGAVAMARSADPNSADSQFYISLGIHSQLDHNYTVFGQVIEGMDTVKRLKVGDKMTSVVIQ